ncbi:MAG: hypothetical protein KIT40_13865 [Nitrospira sp.]|nr:hypothetical protein [Nitrospira sp.]
MHSSTSNSEINVPPAAVLRNATIALCICAVAFVALLELATRASVYRISKNLSRIHQEELTATKIRGGEGGAQQILLLGNSLLLNDVNMDDVRQALSPAQEVNRFAIQATTYYDWYFGIKGLLGKGASPDVVVLCMEPRHLILSSIRNDIFAHYLMSGEDLFDVGRKLRLSWSEISDLFLANQSTFFALRKELRQVLLGRLLPEFPNLTARIVRAPKPQPDSRALRTLGKERLLAIRELLAGTKSKFVLLIMPPVEPDSLKIIEAVGGEIGLTVLAPLAGNGIVDADYQSDGYHLNEQGRDKFTKALLPLLGKLIQ